MKNLGIFLVLLCALWLVDFLFENKQTADFKFMSVQHTNICRAVAAIIIILQHVAGGFGIRYLTPLGGIGVAIFLILSGYDLNESYKKKKSGGDWKTKIIRVLIPYAIVLIVVITMQYLTRTKMEIPYYWYLVFMFFQYLVFYLIISIPMLYTKRYLVLCVVSTVTFISCSCTANGLRAEQAISFLVGVWVSDNYAKAKRWLLNPMILLTLMIGGTLLLATKQIPAIRMHEGEILWQGIQLVALFGAFAIWFVLESVYFANPNMPFLRARQMLSFPAGVLLAVNKDKIERTLTKTKNILILTGGGQCAFSSWQ